MKHRRYIRFAIILGAVMFPFQALHAQYTFTKLDLLGSTSGGSAVISGNYTLISYLDGNYIPSSFLYTGNRYTPIDDLTVGMKTVAEGTDGTSIVGAVEDSQRVGHGFLYSGGAFTTLSYPSATQTAAVAVSGSNIVGSYIDSSNLAHGFLYNGSTYTAITYPGAFKTAARAISGSNIVGTYEDNSHIEHGFLYNGGTYTSISYPGAIKTGAGAVNGSNVIGDYQPTAEHGGLGFLYSGGVFTSISYPGSKETVVTGISGNTIVGTYVNNASGHINGYGFYTNFNMIPQGFVYNVTNKTYATLNVPGSRRTSLLGISGTTIVGVYQDINFVYHAFLATPVTLTISLTGNLAFGSVTDNTTTKKTFTITNTGNATIAVNSITYPEGFSGNFSGPIAPGQTQQVTVTFAPTSAIDYGGNISVNSNATASPSTIAVSGTGGSAVVALVKATATVAPAPVSFNNWSAKYALVGKPTDTPQNDGVASVLKYFTDINPTKPASASDLKALPALARTTVLGTQFLTLTYRQNPVETGLVVELQTSPDARTWTTLTPPDLIRRVGTDPVTGDPIMQVGVKVSRASRLFIRLNVSDGTR